MCGSTLQLRELGNCNSTIENPDGLRAGEQSVAVLSCMDGIGSAGSLLFSSAVLQKGVLISVQLCTQGFKPLHLTVGCASPCLL